MHTDPGSELVLCSCKLLSCGGGVLSNRLQILFNVNHEWNSGGGGGGGKLSANLIHLTTQGRCAYLQLSPGNMDYTNNR